MITVVIPTLGRASLRDTLGALGEAHGRDVIVVDDRRAAAVPLDVPTGVRVLRSGGRGPAAARNVGWRAALTPWVVFLDDDVVPAAGWWEALRADLAGLGPEVGGSQGRLVVPLPAGRAPTDAERNTAALAEAEWITADMAYRREALVRAGGFDERFPHAYREDSDLALRVRRAGFRLVKGERVSVHPVREGGFWSSVRLQRGNASDALMRRLHGPGWRAAIRSSPARLPLHAATTITGLMAIALAPFPPPGGRVSGRLASLRESRHSGERRQGLRGARDTADHKGHGVRRSLCSVAVGVWVGLVGEFAWERIAPGPRTARETARMVVTSVVIPPVACFWRLIGELRGRR